MAITRRVRAPQAAEQPQVTEAAPSTAAPSQAHIRLVNNCSTYVTPKREVFYKDKVYTIDRADLPRFLSYRDDYNRRFFKEVKHATESAVPDDTESLKRGAPEEPRGAAGTVDNAAHSEEETDDEDNELDTGSNVKLEDAEGNPVGVKV